ncbi:hypothetical protein ACE1TF_01155 [Geomicrobium sp. JSM 1781026]|uniref:hypothetical protein n=1 Tax=Geomicrobium sp. JSM 1781026 TaxID=3344580 RepID=UPI0035C262B3
MKKTWLFILPTLMLASCGTNPSQNSGDQIHIGNVDDLTEGYVLGITDETITLNMSPAHQAHALEEGHEFTDMMLRSMDVVRTDELDVIDRNGSVIEDAHIEEGERLRFDFDMAEFDDIEGPIELDYVVVDPVTAEDIIAEYTPSEPGVNVGYVYDETDSLDDLPEEDVNDLLDHPNVLDLYYLPQSADDYGHNYEEIFEIETLPAWVLFDEDENVTVYESLEDVQAELDEY